MLESVVLEFLLEFALVLFDCVVLLLLVAFRLLVLGLFVSFEFELFV